MRRIFQFLIFTLIFLSISILINMYVFFHMSSMFQLEHTIWFWLFLGISSVSFFFTVYLESSNLLLKAIIIAASVWLGVLTIFLFILIGYDILRIFVPINPYLAGWTIVILVGVLSIGGIVIAQMVRTRVVEIRTKRIRRNLRIVHLSDFHLGPIHGATYFARVIRRVKALRPDLVLITGDLLDSTERSTSVSFAVLNELDVPVFLTTGNHEHYIGLEEVSKILKKYNIRILRNEAIETNDIQIVGIDNTASRRHFVSILEKIDEPEQVHGTHASPTYRARGCK